MKRLVISTSLGCIGGPIWMIVSHDAMAALMVDAFSMSPRA